MDKPKKLALFPVYQFEEGFEPPEEGTYYLVASNGIFLHKDTRAGRALIPVKGIPWLEDASLTMDPKLPKVPARIIAQALTFFRKVWFAHRAEAYVTLLYSEKLNQYRLWCPKQTVSAGGVNYDRTDQPNFADRQENDWQMVGTIHSHCNFSAFHSGTDTFDESTFDGIHITLGHVDQDGGDGQPLFSIVSSIAINDKRQSMDPENSCEGVHRQVNSRVSRSRFMTWGDSSFFTLDLTDEDQKGLGAVEDQIEREWMPKVEKQQWGQGFFGRGGSHTDDAADDNASWWHDLYGGGNLR